MRRTYGFVSAAMLAGAMSFGGAPALADHHEGKDHDKAEKSDSTAATKNIVEIAAGNEQFSTLVKALTAAELVEALKGEGPFTVFAPTNAAFAKLPEGTLQSLMKPENRAQLVEVLTYHVVPKAKLMAKDAKQAAADEKEVKTLQGSTLGFYQEGDKLKVSGATISKTDIAATNGVVHVIDTVLLPQEKAGAPKN